MTGLTRASNARITGSVNYRGKEINGLTDNQLRDVRGEQIAMVFQDPMCALNPVYRVGDQITEMIRAHRDVSKKEAQAKAVELLRSVGIPNPERRVRLYPHEFSGGMRQRVMIAMALALEPDVLIADEPTTALDVTIQAQILQLIDRLNRERDLAVIIITHDLGVVAEIADRVLVMYAGQVVEDATLDEIFYEPKHPYTWGLLGSLARLDQPRTARLTQISGAPLRLCCRLRRAAASPRAAHTSSTSAPSFRRSRRAPAERTSTGAGSTPTVKAHHGAGAREGHHRWVGGDNMAKGDPASGGDRPRQALPDQSRESSSTARSQGCGRSTASASPSARAKPSAW